MTRIEWSSDPGYAGRRDLNPGLARRQPEFFHLPRPPAMSWPSKPRTTFRAGRGNSPLPRHSTTACPQNHGMLNAAAAAAAAACSGQDGQQDRRDNHHENPSHTEPEVPSANIVSTHEPPLCRKSHATLASRTRVCGNSSQRGLIPPHRAAWDSSRPRGQQVARPPELLAQRLDRRPVERCHGGGEEPGHQRHSADGRASAAQKRSNLRQLGRHRPNDPNVA
jgi:hypothetical protein